MDGGQQTTKTVSDPWSGVQPYLTGTGGKPGVLPEAAKWYQGAAPEYYQGSTVAGTSPETNQAWNAITARAQGGSPLNAASGRYVQDVLGGNYLNQGNPNQGAVDAGIWGQVAPNIEALFSKGGRSFSPAMAGTMSDAYTSAIAPLHYQDYANQQGRMDAMAQFAPQLAGQDYIDTAALAGVGQDRQGQAQNLINADISRWDFGQNQPYNKLAQYSGLLQGLPGGSTTSTQPGPSAFQQGLGGLLGLGGLGLGYPGWQ